MMTFYVGNLEFKASTKELTDALHEKFHKTHLTDVMIPRTDGRSHSFVTLSWAKASNIIPYDVCKSYSGRLLVDL